MTDDTSVGNTAAGSAPPGPSTGLPPGLVHRLDHVAIAVEDLRAAVHLFADVLGGTFLAGGDDLGLGIRTVQFSYPNGSKVELMTPLRDDADLRRFLDRRGEGFHHVALFVDDLDAAVDRLEGEGYEVVDVEAERPDWHEAFVRPRSGFGTLLQIVQTTRDWATYTTDLGLEQVLAGEVVWVESSPRLKSEAAS